MPAIGRLRRAHIGRSGGLAARRGGTAHDRAQMGDDFTRRGGFEQEVVGTELEPDHTVGHFRGAAGQHHHSAVIMQANIQNTGQHILRANQTIEDHDIRLIGGGQTVEQRIYLRENLNLESVIPEIL